MQTMTEGLVTSRATHAELAGLKPATSDVTLFPSDHIAIKVTLEVGRKGRTG
jgi:hypothetical protein